MKQVIIYELFNYSLKWFYIITFVITLAGCKNENDYNNNKSEVSSLYINDGITNSPRQIDFVIPRSDDQYYVVVDNPHLNTVILKNNKKDTLYLTGDTFEFNNRLYNNRLFILPIDKVFNPDSLSIELSKKGESLAFTFYLLNFNQLNDFLRTDYLIIGISTGFNIIIILLAAIVFLYKRDKKSLYFFLYTLMCIFWSLNDLGILFQTIWPASPTFHSSSRGFFSSLSMILFLLYVSKNENQKFKKGINILLKYLILLVFIKLLLSFLVALRIYPENLKFISMHINAYGLTIYFSIIFISLILNYREFKNDIFELLAILCYCAFVLSHSLKEVGITILNTDLIHYHNALIFLPIQSILMSMHIYQKEKVKEKLFTQRLIEIKKEEQQKLDKKIIEVEEAEKKRIAQNIHDEIGSIFVALKYQISSIEKRLKNTLDINELMGLKTLAEQGIKKQYDIIDDLLFDMSSEKSVEKVLTQHIDLIKLNDNLTINFNYDADELMWKDFHKNQLVKIVKELMTNTIKHANATNISVSISGKSAIILNYSDNGIGFDSTRHYHGNGLKSIQQRINALNGKFEIESSNQGSHFNIFIPLSNA